MIGMERARRVVVLLAGVLAIAGCSTGAGSSSSSSGRVVSVVAGQNFWGSIASQLGGSHARVQTVVTDPNADPHEYESNTNDARAFAMADLVILNGAGYDDWGKKLLDANLSTHRRVLTVADVLGRKNGDNPHFWYNPAWIGQVADRMTDSYKAIDSADSTYFDQQRSLFASALRPYSDRIAEIKAKFSGTAIGATESIFVYTAQALGLNLISPPEFMKALSESTDPPAETVATFQNQIASKQIKVLVYNVQTATDVTTNLKHQAAQQDIPVVGVSETIQPESATFQDWQLAQFLALENALNSDALTK
jgi:zinc/manganese transport system substrate-binding protein